MQGVTPFVGVWIEILWRQWNWHSYCVTPFVGVWIEMMKLITYGKKCTRHSLRGSVDWNRIREQFKEMSERHSLRGSVDWNMVTVFRLLVTNCHSLRGSVDWNLNRMPVFIKRSPSLPSWECGLKSYANRNWSWLSSSLPSWECGLKYRWTKQLHLTN